MRGGAQQCGVREEGATFCLVASADMGASAPNVPLGMESRARSGHGGVTHKKAFTAETEVVARSPRGVAKWGAPRARQPRRSAGPRRRAPVGPAESGNGGVMCGENSVSPRSDFGGAPCLQPRGKRGGPRREGIGVGGWSDCGGAAWPAPRPRGASLRSHQLRLPCVHRHVFGGGAAPLCAPPVS